MSRSLASAENQYKAILEGFFQSKYDEKALPSHGISHHRRVWRYAKDLAPVLAAHHWTEKPVNSASLLIACYLHDIGMSIDPGVKHGGHSADLCREFLNKYNLSENDFPGLLPVIINHDNKDYSSTSSRGDLFTLLSIADDLDAFGFIGIYRYLEIYLHRGIDLKDIRKAIQSNALKRFSHFEQVFSFDREIVEKQRIRYELLSNFYTEYDTQLTFSGEHSSGYCGIVNALKGIIQSENDTREMIREACFSDDPVKRWFFKGLDSEA